MSDVINRELEAGYHSRIQALMTSIDQSVSNLEAQGADPSEILDALIEYVALAEEFDYLR